MSLEKKAFSNGTKFVPSTKDKKANDERKAKLSEKSRKESSLL